jgi:hypothetical protein
MVAVREGATMADRKDTLPLVDGSGNITRQAGWRACGLTARELRC